MKASKIINTGSPVKIFKALADHTRLSMVRELATCPAHIKSCDELSSKSWLSQPAMSHHFQRLVEAGVIIESKTGTAKNYRLNKELLQRSGINVTKL